MASSSVNSSDGSESKHPRDYDELVPVNDLVHGEYNPRKVRPSAALKRSIANDGIAHPLIVRPDPDQDVYHITDGWQRYQAATEAGMEYLPVIIYESPLEALKATEKEDLGKSWTTYDWAQYYQSLADEVGGQSSSTHNIASKIVNITDKERSKTTVQRYLDVLSLPNSIHPLLNEGPSGTPQQWAALQNYNPEVKQYGGLRWQIAAKIARGPAEISKSRQIGIAALTVTFVDDSKAAEYIDQALANPDTDLNTIRKQVDLGKSYDQYLRLRSDIPLGEEAKQSVIEHCRRNGLSLRELIEQMLRDVVDEVEK